MKMSESGHAQAKDLEDIEDFQLSEAQQECWDFLCGCVQKRMLPPAGLAIKHMAVYNKLHAGWHAARLQATCFEIS